MLSEISKIIKSGLNRKLASTVLFSILLVEFLVLIPSVINYKHSQIHMVEMHADLLIETLNSALLSTGKINNPKEFSIHLENHELVRGFSICSAKGCLLRYGEAVDPLSEANGLTRSVLSEDSTRMEVTRDLNSSVDKLWVVLRVDSTMIHHMVTHYIWNTLAMIALVSIFVTIAALVGIAYVVINPILKLKQTMYLAMEDPTQPTKYILENNHQDEIADLTQTYNRLLFDISHYQDQLTESKREVERGLTASEARWKFAIEGSGDGVWDWSPASDEVFFSKQFLDGLGYSEGEFIDKMVYWNDYVHPQDVANSNAAMRDHLSGKTKDYSIEQRVRNKTGHWVWMLSRGMVINRDSSGNATRVVGTHTDISAHKASEKLIWEQANIDSLTQLPNRRLFNNHLQKSVEESGKAKQPFSLMFLDLDNFKIINDTHGHKAGDLLLVQAAKRLKSCIQEGDIVSRLGGDEFTIIINNLSNENSVNRVAENVLEAMSKPFEIGIEAFHVTASIGITKYPDDAISKEILLMNADQAMYEAKALGRNRYRYFSMEMRISAQTRMRTINELRDAVEQKQFEVYYQPIICFKTGKIIKAECLLRWNHPTQGLLGADSIIRLAEETKMIVDIGNWIFYEASKSLAKWRKLYSPDFKISVNTSPAQYIDDGCVVNDWYDHMNELGIPYNSLIVEITEGLLMDLDDVVKAKLDAFREGGVQIAFDDFGTGYSSLAYLQEIHSDFLKIDRTFVSGIMKDQKMQLLCEEIIKIAHIYNTKVIAEGIETVDQSKQLSKMGCDFGQGYLYSKPVSEADFEILLQQQSKKKSKLAQQEPRQLRQSP